MFEGKMAILSPGDQRSEGSTLSWVSPGFDEARSLVLRFRPGAPYRESKLRLARSLLFPIEFPGIRQPGLPELPLSTISA